MSKISSHKLSCSQCGNTQDCKVYESMNVTLDPELKDEFMSNNWNRLYCNKCDAETEIITSMMYHDMDKRFVVWYIPKNEGEAAEDKMRRTLPYDKLISLLGNVTMVEDRSDLILMVEMYYANGLPKSDNEKENYKRIIEEIKNIPEKITIEELSNYPALIEFGESYMQGLWDLLTSFRIKFPELTEHECLMKIEKELLNSN